jgi:hypothetical protein
VLGSTIEPSKVLTILFIRISFFMELVELGSYAVKVVE